MSVLVVIGRPVLEMPDQDELLTLVHPEVPVVNALNLGLTRGDGIFETVGIYNGHVHAEDAHLDRFARSASMLELPEPHREGFRRAVRKGIEVLQSSSEAFCKYVLTRGIEGRESTPFGYAFIDHNPDWTRERTDGISVVTLTRGYPLNIAEQAPWLLQGAKTLSYAVNRAALREAARRRADDVVFTTTDGWALEGPTSSLVLRIGDVFVTPTPDRGVLHGTGQGDVFFFLESQGFKTESRVVSVEELKQADNAWMTSSQRLAAPIRALDGVRKPVDRELTDNLNYHLLHRTG